MAFVFDMRRLHHGCGESLLVQPLKPGCRAKPGKTEVRRLTGRNHNSNKLLTAICGDCERSGE